MMCRRISRMTARRVFVLVAIFASIFASINAPLLADDLDLELSIGSVTANLGDTSVLVPIYLANYNDTVAAFEMRLGTNRPDLISFDRALDTNGTLTAGWQLIGTEFVDDDPHLLRIVGMANWYEPAWYQPGIGYPQYGTVPLLYAKLHINGVPPDTLVHSVAELVFVRDDPRWLLFSDEEGYAIGMTTETTLDTTWFVCLNWAGPTGTDCYLWDRVEGPPADSMAIEPTTQTVLDTSRVTVTEGTAFLTRVCGDVNGRDSKVNLADISYLISYVYLNGNPPPSLWAADVTGSPDGAINLADISRLISFVYLNGSPLNCQ